MDLRKELAGVPQDSPPVDHEPEVKASEKSEGDGEKGDGRSLENVRGELIRKQDKLRDELAEIKAEIRSLARGTAVSPQQPNKSKTELDDYSVSELSTLRAQVPEENRADFDAYLLDRKMREQLDNRFSVFTEAQKLQQERDQYNRAALGRFPDLNDLTSEFAREVNARLREVPEEMANRNPRVVYDIANDVALEKGVQPAARRVVRGRPATADTEPAPREAPSYINSDEERMAIAAKLKGALPKGKDFDIEEIKKREQAYANGELDYHINRKG